VVDRELDQVTRMWMPYDNGFLASSRISATSGRWPSAATTGYGSSTLARLWIDK
jgi:hypothetical protein